MNSLHRIITSVCFGFALLNSAAFSKETAAPSYSAKCALVIGVDKFQEKRWNFVDGEKDAKDFKNYLIKHAHFSEKNVISVLGRKVTKASVIAAFNHLKKIVPPDSLIVIYLRSRGILVSEETNRCGIVAFFDTVAGRAQDTGLVINKIPAFFSGPKQFGPIVFIIDTDFAGDWIRTLQDHCTGDDKTLTSDPINVLCATDQNQISWHSETSRNSVFTRKLIDELVKMGENANIVDAANRISESIEVQVRKERSRQQSPNTMASSRDSRFIDVNLAAPVLNKMIDKKIE